MRGLSIPTAWSGTMDNQHRQIPGYRELSQPTYVR